MGRRPAGLVRRENTAAKRQPSPRQRALAVPPTRLPRKGAARSQGVFAMLVTPALTEVRVGRAMPAPTRRSTGRRCAHSALAANTPLQ